MSKRAKIRRIVLAAALLGAGVTVAALYRFPPEATGPWYVALGTLFTISLISHRLGLRISESGAYTSPVYIPYLASVALTGPAGTILLVLLSQGTSQFLIQRKPARKGVFNTAQTLISAGFAAFTYSLLGGQSSLSALPLETTALPFLAAAGVYFLTNHLAVAYIMSVAEYGEIREMWGRIFGKTILFDIAISPLAYLVAYLYTLVGALGLAFALIPIFGLRYIYGTTLQLRQLSRDLLTVLIKTLEAQDPYTSGHSVRVAERARKIAKEMGLGLQEIEHIETAALLHDIGKIDNAYHELLRQEGPLTGEQKRLIREHPERGVAIIRSVRSLDPDVLAFVRHHHERCDGTGYPDGLSGDAIPLGARIIMVSDTIDAMSTARPYRSALPMSEIRHELREFSGTQFDPAVVEAAFASGVVEEEPVTGPDSGTLADLPRPAEAGA